MNAVLQKERRSLRPAFLATIAATILCALILNGSDASGVVIVAYAVGTVLIAASAFGNEFHSRTMLLLLSQPVPRRQLWSDKMRELALELFVSFVVLILSLAFVVHGEGRLNSLGTGGFALCLIPLIAFCSAPYMTLCVKHVLGAMAFIFVLPYALVMVVLLIDWALSTLVGHQDLFLNLLSDKHPNIFWVLIGAAAIAYCIALYRAGYHTFLNLQLIDSQSRELSLPGFLERPLTRYLGWLTPGYSGPLSSLARKELRLQRPAFIVAGFGAVLLPILFVAWALHKSEILVGIMAMVPVLCMFVTPLLTGLLTVSEERNMGVLAWQLTQPVSPHKQWSVKLLVAFSASVLLGVIFPWIVLVAGHEIIFGPPHPLDPAYEILHPPGDVLIFWTLFYIVIFGLVVFGSTISTNTSRGIAAALGMLFACASAIALAFYTISELIASRTPQWSDAVHEYAIRHGIAQSSMVYDVATIITSVGVVLIIIGVVWLNGLSFANFRSDELPARRIRNQIVKITLYVLICSLVMGTLITLDNHLPSR